MTISLLTLAIVIGALILAAVTTTLHVHAMVRRLRVQLAGHIDAVQNVHGTKLAELETRLDIAGAAQDPNVRPLAE